MQSIKLMEVEYNFAQVIAVFPIGPENIFSMGEPLNQKPQNRSEMYNRIDCLAKCHASNFISTLCKMTANACCLPAAPTFSLDKGPINV